MNAADTLIAAPRRVGYLPVLAAGGALLLGLIAVVLPGAALLLVAAAAFVVVSFRSLAGGLALFTVLISIEQVPAFAVGIGFVKLAGGVLAAAWAVQLLTHRRESRELPRDRPWVAATAAALFVWAVASSLWAADSSVALSSALRLGQGILLLFIVYAALRERRDVRRLLAAYVLGALLAAGFGIASGGSESGRLAGGVGNPNELAAFLLPALLVCTFAALGERRALLQWSGFVVGLLLLLALFMTGSRGGLAGLAVALVAAVILAGPARLRVVALVLVIVGGASAYYLTAAPQEQVDRLSALREDGGTGRTDLWSIAVAMARDRPLTGVGAGNFTVAEPQYAAQPLSLSRIDLVLDESKVAHNTYLSFLSQLGIVGVVLFAAVVLTGLAAAALAVQRLRGKAWEEQRLARGFAAGLAGMLAAFTFSSADYEKHLWLLTGVALALPAVVGRRHPSAEDGGGESSAASQPARQDYHRPMGELDSGRHIGEAPQPDLVVASTRRLARREAALAEREELVTRRERELRDGASGGHGTAVEALGRAPVIPVAALVDASDELRAVREDLDALRDALEQTLVGRAADTQRLAAAEAFVRETEERAQEQRRKDEAAKSRLRAKVRELQRANKRLEEETLALREQLRQWKRVDRRERLIAERERRLRREDA